MKDVEIHHPAIAVVGRVFFTLIFFASGITHFTDIDGYVALLPAAFPQRELWVLVSGVVELAGATLILTNRLPKLGAWLIVAFLVPVTVAVHGVMMVKAADQATLMIQQSFFLKGVTMTGAALLFTQLGVSRAAASGH